MKIDPRRLSDLLAVADLGSITAAAKAQNVSQPALSNSISTLEHAVGAKLLVRRARGVTLTQIGEALVKYARSLDAVLTRAAYEIHLRKTGRLGSLAIGVRPTAAVSLVPEALGRLHAQTAGISVTLIEGGDDKLLESLRAGEIDLVVGPINPQVSAPDLSEEVLLPDPFVVLMRADHPSAHVTLLTPSKIHEVKCILPLPGTVVLRQIDALFMHAGLEAPLPFVSTNSLTAIRALLSQGETVAIISNQIADAECRSGQFVRVRIEDPGPRRFIGVQHLLHTDLNPTTLQFLQTLRTVAQEKLEQLGI